MRNFSLALVLFMIASPAMGSRSIYSDESSFSWIGYYKYGDHPNCTVWFLSPNLVVTAKHCFTHSGQSEQKLNGPDGYKKFIKIYLLKQIVTGSDIEEIIFIKNRDIAVIKLKKQLEVDDAPKVVVSNIVPFNQRLYTAGYPTLDTDGLFQVVDKNCFLTKEEGLVASIGNNLGYDGILHGTTCLGWFRASGSPLFSVNADGSYTVYGVAAHTFLIDELGDVNSDSRDHLGPVLRVAFSLFRNVGLKEEL